MAFGLTAGFSLSLEMLYVTGEWVVAEEAVENTAVGIGTATDLLALLNGVLWTVSC